MKNLRAALVSLIIFCVFIGAWQLSTSGPAIGGASTGMTAEQIEDAINHIKRQLVAIESREISSREIGAMVMHELQRVDQVAYIRFASVYLSFEDIQAFQDAIHRLAAEPTPEMHQRQVPLIDEDS